MMQKMVISFVISFVMRQLEKFQTTIDWNQVQKDLDDRIRALIPGTWFDDEAVSYVNIALTAIKSALGQGDAIKNILTLLADQKNTDAVNALKSLVLNSWSNFSVAGVDTKSLIEEHVA